MPTATRFAHSLLGGALLLAAPGWAQAPTLVSTSPVRSVTTVGRLSSLSATFSQAVTGAAGLRLSSSTRGYLAATPSGNGTTTLSLQPTQAFAAGEQLMLTIPATVQSTSGTALSSGQVMSFQVAGGPASYVFSGGSAHNGTGPITPGIPPILGDVNNDGWLDMVVTDGGANFGLLYLGNGQGLFATTGQQLVPGTSPQGAALADFNNDGRLDLATASADDAYGVTLSLGVGNGTFTAPAVVAAGRKARHPRAADVNGDGNQDLLYLQQAAAGTTLDAVIVLLGDGLGGFAAPLPLAAPPDTRTFYVQDLNNDGKLDLLTYSFYTSTSIYTFLGTGQGTFGPRVTAAGVDNSYPLSQFGLGDMDGDGIIDLVMPNFPWNHGTNPTVRGYVKVYPGTGQGTFGTGITAGGTLPVSGYQYVSNIVLADINGDGRLDMIEGTGGASSSSFVMLQINEGQNAYSAARPQSMWYNLFAAGDVNNDGTIDFVMTGDYFRRSEVSLRLNSPLATAPTITNVSPTSGAPGTLVTLTGTNFTGATAVLVGGVSVPYTITPGGTITFAVPAGVPHGLISVITPTGTATSGRFALVLAGRGAAAALAATVFPNPATGQAQVQLPTGTGAVQAELYSPLGQLVRRVRLMPAAGQAPLDLTGLAPALYTLKLRTATHSSTLRLAVE
ncbi:FG-GAP-like repeat-containing protein [Hymenobacter edaphi]|uniref:T9SS type A sorting domain-containing protein n=1 Tax=Hymenobacter edaphi TaxID=2211146 RepID=A0A328BT92_9BACT|nr:FG-GAP-like repeat-containing protein [Hymenobacter edaphi]RAK69895.1 hypothetical protein DLM85_03300 [Hymenobacter edaphi]